MISAFLAHSPVKKGSSPVKNGGPSFPPQAPDGGPPYPTTAFGPPHHTATAAALAQISLLNAGAETVQFAVIDLAGCFLEKELINPKFGVECDEESLRELWRAGPGRGGRAEGAGKDGAKKFLVEETDDVNHEVRCWLREIGFGSGGSTGARKCRGSAQDQGTVLLEQGVFESEEAFVDFVRRRVVPALFELRGHLGSPTGLGEDELEEGRGNELGGTR